MSVFYNATIYFIFSHSRCTEKAKKMSTFGGVRLLRIVCHLCQRSGSPIKLFLLVQSQSRGQSQLHLQAAAITTVRGGGGRGCVPLGIDFWRLQVTEGGNLPHFIKC